MAKENMNISLIDSMKVLGSIVGAYFAYKTTALIFLIIYGSIADVALGGTITVPTVINTSINASVNSVSTAMGTFNSSDAFVLGLITLVVVLNLFKPWIKKSGSSKKGSLN